MKITWDCRWKCGDLVFKVAKNKTGSTGMVTGRANGLVLAGVIAACLLAWPAAAQEAEGGFTFKRIKPPGAGAGKRITVTIDKTWPYDYAAPARPSKPPVETAPDDTQAALPFAAFWDLVSPTLEAADPNRLDMAMAALNAVPDDKASILPDTATLESAMKSYGPQILLATAGKRVSPALVLAVIAVESAGKPGALSPKGAQGLMQLIPATAKRFGVEDSNDPAQNIMGGVAYLDWLLGEFRGDPLLSLAGYNAGENAVLSNKGIPPYAETRAYVPKVVAAWERARMYCQTLPVYADDGCVFAFDRSFLK